MRQTLFYIPLEIFGFPLFGFGILFWVILIATAVFVLYRLGKGKANTDTWGYLPICLIAEALIVFVVPNIAEPQGFPIRGYGVFLLLAISAAMGLLLYRSKKLWNIPADLIFSLALWCIICGLIGARLFYVIEYWPQIRQPTLLETLVDIVSFAKGGLVVYGSIIGGIVGALIFIIRNRLPLYATFDLLAPAVLLGIAIGRLGCLMNGCCFGAVCEAPYGMVFPPGSPVHLHQIEHDEVFAFGLKFAETPPTSGMASNEAAPRIPISPWEDHEEVLRHYAKDKRSAVRIEEVEPGSEAERLGLKKGMTVLAIEGYQQGTPLFFLARDKASVLYCLLETIENHKDFVLTTDSPEPFHTYIIKNAGFKILPVYPTQIISAISAAAGAVLLLLLARFCKRDGWVLLLFFIFYPIGRFLLEMLRCDEDSFLGTGLTISQNTSLVLLVFALFLGWSVFRGPKTRAYEGRFQ